MRRTRFMSWFFLVLSLAFFLVRDFRFALEAPLASHWLTMRFSPGSSLEGPPKPSRLDNLYTLKRYASTEKLKALAEEAARRGDSKFVAFAALNLPVKEAKAEVLRLADKAVEADRGLTWIYYPLASRLWEEEGGWEHVPRDTQEFIRGRADRLQASDPDNAVPHLARLQLIQASRGKDWPVWKESSSDPAYLNALAKETEWRKEMEAVFASPRYDSYASRRFDLYRYVLRERGWDHPAVVAPVLGDERVLNLEWLRIYTEFLVLKLGADAEAAGQFNQAFVYYWEAAQFASRVRLQAQDFTESLIAQTCQLIAYRRLAPALRMVGRKQEAEMLKYAEKQMGEDWKREAVYLKRTTNYEWSVLLVNSSAGLVAVFSLITLISVVYVNAKLWIRKEKKGRLFKVLSATENYAPILLFLSCLALYLSFVPFGRDYTHYMTTKETFASFPPDLIRHMYPSWAF